MKIGLYPGSFNMFHKGHYDILLKAELIFDKVIIGRGINPDKKPSEMYPLPQIILDRHIINYTGLLTDVIKQVQKEYNVTPTVIRGIRNSIDLQYELNQYRYLQDLMPEIQMISIFSNKEFEHISSSGIRSLSIYGEDKIKPYLL